MNYDAQQGDMEFRIRNRSIRFNERKIFTESSIDANWISLFPKRSGRRKIHKMKSIDDVILKAHY